MISSSNPLGILVVTLDAIFLNLGAVAIAIRFISRRVLKQTICLNDYLAIVSWVGVLSCCGIQPDMCQRFLQPLMLLRSFWVSPDTLCGDCVLILEAVNAGMGEHVDNFALAVVDEILKVEFIEFPLTLQPG